MKKKSIILGIILGGTYITGTCQTVLDNSLYYYYKGEKQYIELNTQQAFASVPVSAFSKVNLELNTQEWKNENYSEIIFDSEISSQIYLK